MTLGVSIRLMIFSGPLQRGQIKGSASYTFLIMRAQDRLAARALSLSVSWEGVDCSAGGQAGRAWARRTWENCP